jgi:hypothetical protein
MASERVVIEVQPAPSPDFAIGKVTADFNMRNTGSAPETMQVRFPLADPSGMGDRSGRFPEVVGFAVSAGGTSLPTTVITTTNPQGDGDPVRWAAFDVTFPPDQDLAINVTYSITSTGYSPSARFAYVLETGAGWNGPIGSADVIVRLPYPATTDNVFQAEDLTRPGAQLVENEVRWHWDNLEPKSSDNVYLTTLVPQVWQRILDARTLIIDQAQYAPNYSALAEAYQAAITRRFPIDEGDPFAKLADETMRQATTLDPNSAPLRATHARLIWDQMAVMAGLTQDDPNLQRVLSELAVALAIEPQNAEAQALLAEIRTNVEGDVTLPTVQLTPTPQAPSPVPPTTVPSTPTTPPAPADTGSNLPLILLLVGVPLLAAAVALTVFYSRRNRPS